MSDESDSFPPMHPSIHGIGRERARKARLESEAVQPQPGAAAQADTDPDMVAVSRFSFAEVLPKEPAQWPQSRTRLLTLLGASGALVLVFVLAYFLFAPKSQHHGGTSIKIGHSVTPTATSTATGQQGQPVGVPSATAGSATPASSATIQAQETPTSAPSGRGPSATQQPQATPVPPTPVPPTATPQTCGKNPVPGNPTSIVEPDGTVLGYITVTLQPILVSNAHGGCTLDTWNEVSFITLNGDSINKVSAYTNGGPCAKEPYSCGLYQQITENNTRQSSIIKPYGIYGNPFYKGIYGPTLGNLPYSSCATAYGWYQDNAGRDLGNATSALCVSSS